MSWYISTTSQTAETLEATARPLYEAFRADHGDSEANEAMDDQFEIALSSAKAMLASAALGSGPCAVTLSGHANPNHLPRPGWAHDTLSITVNQQLRRSPAPTRLPPVPVSHNEANQA